MPGSWSNPILFFIFILLNLITEFNILYQLVSLKTGLSSHLPSLWHIFFYLLQFVILFNDITQYLVLNSFYSSTLSIPFSQESSFSDLTQIYVLPWYTPSTIATHVLLPKEPSQIFNNCISYHTEIPFTSFKIPCYYQYHLHPHFLSL